MASSGKMLHWVETSTFFAFRSINQSKKEIMHTAKKGTAGQINKPDNKHKTLTAATIHLLLIGY